jgi:hypothetical protein
MVSQSGTVMNVTEMRESTSDYDNKFLVLFVNLCNLLLKIGLGYELCCRHFYKVQGECITYLICLHHFFNRFSGR